jgi:glycine hydroxymethyltransferase
MNVEPLADFASRGFELLREEDRSLYDLLEREHDRQARTLAMVAASSIADPSVIACEATVTANVTTEGYPGARFHAGCQFVDEIERLAVERARAAFGARYANVQPHSGSSANEVVMFSLLRPGDAILGLDLNCGGHLTHGASTSVSGQYFQSRTYGLDARGFIDYEGARRVADEHRARLIVTGASAYPRIIDFRRFREIADEVGAYLLADISHIAGLVAAGEHPSPIDHAHFTTTSTYKQLYGPRGGLILIGRDADRVGPDGKRTLAELVQKAVFPFFQGTPGLNAIAAKARALGLVQTPGFRSLARRIVTSARALAEWFDDRDYHVLTGGTDTHMVFIDVASSGITGVVAERALEECDIIVNKNRIPGDTRPPTVTSGMRLGTNSLAARGLTADDMPRCAALVDRVMRSLEVSGPSSYHLPADVRAEVREEVARICREFPLPRYGAPPVGARAVNGTAAPRLPADGGRVSVVQA